VTPTPTPSVVDVTGCLVLTLEQVAPLLRISMCTAYRWLRRGTFPIPPHSRVGRRYLWSAHTVDRYLRRPPLELVARRVS